MTSPIILSQYRATRANCPAQDSGTRPSREELDDSLAILDFLIEARCRMFRKLLKDQGMDDGEGATAKVTKRLQAINEQRSAISVLEKTRRLLFELREVGNP